MAITIEKFKQEGLALLNRFAEFHNLDFLEVINKAINNETISLNNGSLYKFIFMDKEELLSEFCEEEIVTDGLEVWNKMNGERNGKVLVLKDVTYSEYQYIESYFIINNL